MLNLSTSPADTTTTPSAPQARGKNDQILAGLRRLAEKQRHGQAFSQTEVAAACGITRKAVYEIENRAICNFTKRLAQICPDAVAEAMHGRPIREIFTLHGSDPLKFRRPRAAAKVPAPRKPRPSMTLEECADKVAADRRAGWTRLNHSIANAAR